VFSNVLVVTQQNQGASAARNKAFELCQGDYIQWLDADDLVSPDKVAKQMAAAEQYQDTRRLLSSGWGYFMYRPSRAKFSTNAAVVRSVASRVVVAEDGTESSYANG